MLVGSEPGRPSKKEGSAERRTGETKRSEDYPVNFYCRHDEYDSD